MIKQKLMSDKFRRVKKNIFILELHLFDHIKREIGI